MTPRHRNFALAAAAFVVASSALVWVIRSNSRGSAKTASTQSSPSASKTPPQMSGMTMTTGGGITLSLAQLHDLGITFGTVEMRPLVSEARTAGVVTIDETRTAQVTPKFGGFIERLYVNSTGQKVSHGQALFEIYSPELVAAEQELLLAAQLQRNIGQSTVPGVPASNTDLVASAKRRLQLLDISQAQIDEILRSGRVLRTLTLHSPASGVVITKDVVVGQSVVAGQPLYTIADLSSVWVDVQLRETDAGSARAGTAADIEVAGLPGRTLKGQLAYLYPTLDTVSRALRARIVVNNGGGLLRPGVYATVHLRTPNRAALTVPTSAILRSGTRNVVFVASPGADGHLTPVEIQTGSSGGEYTEVVSGLLAGQRVVTSAQFLLDSESNLGEVIRSMISQAPGTQP